MWCFLAPALAGDLVGEVALDSLSAAVKRDNGEQEAASELGMRVRADLSEVDDRLTVAVDYRGREPIVGTNSTHRLLYAAVADFAVVEKRLSVGFGRFIAPSTLLLPVDGLRVVVDVDDATSLSVFGGRRGISTSRMNLGLDTLLPAAGLSFRRITQRWQLEALFAYAGDELRLANGGVGDVRVPVYGANGLVRTLVAPTDPWMIGGQLAFAQQASYALGPTWADVTGQAEATDLFSALVYAVYSPTDSLRFDADLHHQSVQLFFAGTREGEETVPALQEPNHTDVRLRAGARPLQLGWVRAEGRFRRRPGVQPTVPGPRQELRVGASADLDTLGVTGLVVSGRAFVDSIMGPEQADNVGAIDRLFWSTSAGYKGHGLDVRAGVSFIERAATPVSGLQGSLAEPGQPTESRDLGPFVLEAQNIAFVRGFYVHKRWFTGLDVEANLQDTEVRVFAQVGMLGDWRW